jgi:hypothetical protein
MGLPPLFSGSFPVYYQKRSGYSPGRKTSFCPGAAAEGQKGRRHALYDKRINLKLQFPLLHIIPAGEDFYF